MKTCISSLNQSFSPNEAMFFVAFLVNLWSRSSDEDVTMSGKEEYSSHPCILRVIIKSLHIDRFEVGGKRHLFIQIDLNRYSTWSVAPCVAVASATLILMSIDCECAMQLRCQRLAAHSQ